jgi:hypothetical protein
MMMTAEAAWIRVWARRVGQRPEIKREFLLPSCSVSTLRSRIGDAMSTMFLDHRRAKKIYNKEWSMRARKK